MSTAVTLSSSSVWHASTADQAAACQHAQRLAKAEYTFAAAARPAAGPSLCRLAGSEFSLSAIASSGAVVRCMQFVGSELVAPLQ
jgi:hypothetical protein